MKIAIAGSTGRMGRTLIEAVCASADLKLSAALDIARSPALGKDAGEVLGIACGVAISADYAAGIAASDCLIDFTRPEASLLHLQACLKSGTNATSTPGIIRPNDWTGTTNAKVWKQIL